MTRLCAHPSRLLDHSHSYLVLFLFVFHHWSTPFLFSPVINHLPWYFWGTLWTRYVLFTSLLFVTPFNFARILLFCGCGRPAALFAATGHTHPSPQLVRSDVSLWLSTRGADLRDRPAAAGAAAGLAPPPCRLSAATCFRSHLREPPISAAVPLGASASPPRRLLATTPPCGRLCGAPIAAAVLRFSSAFKK